MCKHSNIHFICCVCLYVLFPEQEQKQEHGHGHELELELEQEHPHPHPQQMRVEVEVLDHQHLHQHPQQMKVKVEVKVLDFQHPQQLLFVCLGNERKMEMYDDCDMSWHLILPEDRPRKKRVSLALGAEPFQKLGFVCLCVCVCFACHHASCVYLFVWLLGCSASSRKWQRSSCAS